MRAFARMLIHRPGLRFLAVEQKSGASTLWNLPGGKVEPDEEPRCAAIREVLEETGFRCDRRLVRRLCRRKLTLGSEVWIGHFFVYAGPLYAMENREPEKIVDLRWLDVDEARTLQAHQHVFADIFEFALSRFTIAFDPGINSECLERPSNSLKRRNLAMRSIFAI